MWRWGRRQPLAALLLFAVIALLAVADVWSARTRLHERKRQVDQSNINVAQSVAATERERLRRLRFAVFDAAQSPEPRALLRSGAASEEARQGLHQWLRGLHERFNDPAFGFASSHQARPFDSWFLLDADGGYLAHSAERKTEGSFHWRDYYTGAMNPARGPHTRPYVSKVYRAQRGGHYYKFAIATPIYADGRPIAVLVGSVLTETTRGHLLPARSRQIAAIVAPRDRSGPDKPLPPKKVILGHPRYQPGKRAVEVCHHGLASVGAGAFVTDSYRDPILDGRWVAAFVPLAETEFVVVVQQRYDQAIGARRVWGRLIGRWAGGLALVAVVLLAGTLWHRRRLRPARGPDA
jgi:hypothetical protein